MNVQLAYRNYKPLHDLYRSLLIEPPPQVSYVLPRTLRFARRFYPLYLMYGDWGPARSLMHMAQHLLFGRAGSNGQADAIHYIQMIPGNVPSTPYVIDFEHAAALANFVHPDDEAKNRILRFLMDDRCRRIIPLTWAARRSLLSLFPDLDPGTASKVEVIYPALPDYSGLCRAKGDDVLPRREEGKLKFLFVGNDVYRKGLHELMAAFRELEKRYTDIELCVVSDAPGPLKKAHPSRRIKHVDPVYPFDQMIERFYLACDVLVLPTHCDTFGMAILCALSCGKPVVTTHQFASAELVRDGENGLLVRSGRLLLEEVCMPDRTATRAFATREADPLLIGDLIEKLGTLCANPRILKRMSEEAAKDFCTGGKFSIGKRNGKLSKAYADCEAPRPQGGASRQGKNQT
ncbi:MAG TPA: glycosyltransferase family 4 protein [Syntrophales bacterium]|nr:glycosyltransferase family 4 protein [Syntrophales bacterium]